MTGTRESRIGRRALATGIGVAAAASLALSGQASAATTIGAPEYQNPGITSYNGLTVIQTMSTPESKYAVPFDGVITSWGKFASFSTVQQMKLKIGRLPVGATNSTPPSIVGESALESLSNLGQKNTFPTRITVKAGDRLGIYSANGGPASVDNEEFPYTFRHFSHFGDRAIGEGVENGPAGSYELVVYATVEPDADKDGFGDETQDKCKGSAGANNGCGAAKKKKCKKKGKKGAAAAKKKKGCKKGKKK